MADQQRNLQHLYGQSKGIGTDYADSVLIEGTIVANNYSVLIYIEGVRDCIVVRNYMYGNTNRCDRSDNGKRANGINIANEVAAGAPCVDIVIANNIIADTYKGIGFWCADTNPNSNNRYSDVKIWHNTIVSSL